MHVNCLLFYISLNILLFTQNSLTSISFSFDAYNVMVNNITLTSFAHNRQQNKLLYTQHIFICFLLKISFRKNWRVFFCLFDFFLLLLGVNFLLTLCFCCMISINNLMKFQFSYYSLIKKRRPK